ncbi:thiamine phosphate synthase [Corynebacterium freiburgense]|uniref:thiamine phosphate synthase n=1 Tax=Corynebacterium freiburgense TaxID=556548 RepID=UPI000420255D|nr:thiamine phosphate synthase [Corynebacterium freiburgense]WJZ03745.1 Thiamine-phosphate synthase [Corynebacterium freiburgense]
MDSATLYLVTDARRHVYGNNPRGLVELAEQACAAGVDIIQLRDKNSPGVHEFGAMEAGQELEFLSALREVCQRYGKLMAVNDRADIAYAAKSDVFHIGQKDLPPLFAREILGPDVIIGKSCHTASDIDVALADPCVDYFCTGPVWSTPTKPGRAAVGLDLVRVAAEKEKQSVQNQTVFKPWFAIGGINKGSVGSTIAAGARRIVVVRAITEAPDPGVAVTELLAAINHSIKEGQ